MRDRFARELVRAARLDAPPRGACERALAVLGLQSGSGSFARAASGAALVALAAVVLGWAPPASQPVPQTDSTQQCTDGIESPPCLDPAR